MKSTKRHTPQRTCVACRQGSNKGELVRLVRIADGSIEVDTSGRKNGRGAYLCRARECWQLGVNGKRLEHALRTNLAPENREQLNAYGETLPG